jgi:hypothetical protein
VSYTIPHRFRGDDAAACERCSQARTAKPHHVSDAAALRVELRLLADHFGHLPDFAEIVNGWAQRTPVRARRHRRE